VPRAIDTLQHDGDCYREECERDVKEQAEPKRPALRRMKRL
jgi:hypothetical protein